jgi:hypothetical protein
VCASRALAQGGGQPPAPKAEPAPAQPSPEILACVRDHERAQVEAVAGHVKQALELALACSKDVCPSYARNDCLKFADEYRAKLPSVTVRARGTDGCDTADANVSIDGVLVAERLEGRALPVDPGAHTIVVQVPGVAAEEQKIVAAEGERDRVLTFGDARAKRCGAPVEPPKKSGGFSGLTVGGMVLGGIGLAALATSGGLGIKGLVERGDLDECKPTCSDDQIATVRLNFIIGDVFLATGVAAVGTAIVLIVVGTSEPGPDDQPAKPALQLDVGPRNAGGALRLSGSF